MNESLPCDEVTLADGHCYGLSVCGWCYDYGETRVVSKEYEVFNSAIFLNVYDAGGLIEEVTKLRTSGLIPALLCSWLERDV
ncbi:hypothetical protein OESDEN_12204 [Oesophagostomum dentatum]|uniref:Uncharacterized protein n=1 Tax=Oesophagostomum dentatum TaxID=61180 RepID=A0A0B1SXT4_OESDE|nr:hypothetical protein OESDEN_12204 [Oesophagostomum dentatum]